MRRGSFAAALALCFLGVVRLHAQTTPATPTSWTGVLINSTCNANEAFNEASKCSQGGPGTKLGLYADSIRQVYQLAPPVKLRGKWKIASS